MLSDAELASIRATVAEFLPNTCTVKRPSGATASDGRPSGATTTICAAGTACRVDAVNQRRREIEFAQGSASFQEWDIVLPHSVAEIKAQDTVDVTGLGKFEVTGSTSGRSTVGCVVVRCIRVDHSAAS